MRRFAGIDKGGFGMEVCEWSTRVFSTVSRGCGMRLLVKLMFYAYAIVATDHDVRVWAAYACCL